MKAFLCFMYIYDLPQMMWKQRVIVKILFIPRTLFIFHRKTRTCFLKNMSNFSKKDVHVFQETRTSFWSPDYQIIIATHKIITLL
ncbi:hypothetical protein B5F32_14175 [Parabacteroides distasonis]|uniref:Uncharacterized protein n=1 Tax=Parabacteroides distasonis TaxID=823 RepID=A0A1Y4IJU4_PARDI|nr:hypothetical protein B5F32_14175 [Parabacteroides distasonis]